MIEIDNGKIVETGAKELPLIQMYMNSNLILDCVTNGRTNTHTHLSKIIVIKHHQLIIA
jgi:hypothetical protein